MFLLDADSVLLHLLGYKNVNKWPSTLLLGIEKVVECELMDVGIHCS